MLDLHSGEEKWNLRIQECYLGDAAVRAIDGNGTCYIDGSEGPDPVAVSQDGEVLWKSAINDPAVYEPYEMTVDSQIEVKYRCGSSDNHTTVAFDLSGQMISSRTEIDEKVIASVIAQADEIAAEIEMDISKQEPEGNDSEQLSQEESPAKENEDDEVKEVEELNNNPENNESNEKEIVEVYIEPMTEEFDIYTKFEILPHKPLIVIRRFSAALAPELFQVSNLNIQQPSRLPCHLQAF